MTGLLTFIGFGEGAFHIAKGLTEAGATGICAYDVMWDHPAHGGAVKARAEEAGVALYTDSAEAVRASRFVLSATSASVAVKVAEGTLPHMNSDQIYVDINAGSPMDMEQIGTLCDAAGVSFCDVAVMGIIPQYGHKVPLIVSGGGAAAFREAFAGFGMDLELLEAGPGGASAIKMFRSIFMKGYSQLLIESFCAAERFGVLDKIVASLNDTVGGKSVEDMANALLPRTVIHAKRRIAEMEDVQKTLASLGQTAHMSRATADKLRFIHESGVAEHLNGQVPADYREAVRALISVGR